MGRKREEIRASELQGCKYFKLIPELLKSLRDVGTERDKAGNREFFCDHYVSLLLLYFFSPVISSLNGLREATELDKVQKLLGIQRVSMGTLSESAGVFDPAPLQDVIRELAPLRADLKGAPPSINTIRPYFSPPSRYLSQTGGAKVLLDPWQNEYLIAYNPAFNQAQVWSLGPDGVNDSFDGDNDDGDDVHP